VHPDLLSPRFGYVSVSRASHDATIFTNDVAEPSQMMEVIITKSSALAPESSVFINQTLDVG
jgi:hypothetical protein